MVSRFSLYNKTASFFDLIDGDRETKQTKGLGWILSHDIEALASFFSIPIVETAVFQAAKKRLKMSNVTYVEVATEAPTASGKYVDIVIRVDVNLQPFVALVIEAKSALVTANTNALTAQIGGYLQQNQISSLTSYPTAGIVITRHRHVLPTQASGIIHSLMWEDIVHAFSSIQTNRRTHFTNNYLSFITGLQTMRCYEQEVLSVAARTTLPLVKNHFIYSCPDTKSYTYQKSLFMAFRGEKGVMHELYRVQDVVVFNPLNRAELSAFTQSNYDQTVIKRILNYIKAASPYTNPAIIHNSPTRFYVLGNRTIPLPHQPRPQRNNVGTRYYCLNDILTNQIVTPC